MLRVAIVDDFEPDRESLCRLLGSLTEPVIELVGVFDSAASASVGIQSSPPDVLLADIEMPHTNGLELARLINERYPGIRIVFCTLYDEFEYAREALNLHSSGYVLKPVDLAELETCLRKVETDIIDERRNASERDRMESILRKRRPHLVEHLLRNFLLDLPISATDRDELTGVYGVGFSESPFHVVAVEIDTSPGFADTLPSAPKRALVDRAVDSLRAIAEKWGFPFVCIDDEHYVIVALTEEASAVFTVGSQVLAAIQPAHPNVTIAISDPCSGLQRLPDCYRQCRKILQQKFALGGGRIITSNDLPIEHYDHDSDPVDLLTGTRLVINSTDAQELADYLDNVLLARVSQYSARHLRDVCSSMITCIRTVLEENLERLEPLLEGNHSVWERLESMETVTEAAEWIGQIIEKSRKLLEQRASTRDGSVVAAVRQFVAENYGRNIGLDSVADDLRISPNHMNHIFKQHTGKTVTAYITETKMGKAAALLMDPRIRVCEVAEAVGFGNSAYFYSVFKKHFGVTPREYRERHYHAEP